MVIVTKNGRTIVVNGDIVQGKQIINNMTISGGKITVDGKPLSELDQEDEKVINITIQGDVERLKIDYCGDVHITGNAGDVETHGGNIQVQGDVEGDVESHGGNILCGNISGDCTSHGGNIFHS